MTEKSLDAVTLEALNSFAQAVSIDEFRAAIQVLHRNRALDAIRQEPGFKTGLACLAGEAASGTPGQRAEALVIAFRIAAVVKKLRKEIQRQFAPALAMQPATAQGMADKQTRRTASI